MKTLILAAILMATTSGTVNAQWINSSVDNKKIPAFDITKTEVTTDGRLTTFTTQVAGIAGSVTPVPTGQVTGSKVESYVWPTNMDPSKVGFDKNSGILALTLTAHPDFDDTPIYDENQDGNPVNDGAGWHSHWIVLVKETICGGGLKVRDILPGKDLLPATAPYLPIALDSPGMSPILNGNIARITVPLADAENVAFDAVTAELQVNANGKVPFLCVTNVHDIASGDLSLPGKISAKK